MMMHRFTVSGKVLYVLLALAAGYVGLALPVKASAEVIISPPPIQSTASGLPGGRAYEHVSPQNKNANDAGASTNVTLSYGGLAHYALASPDGQSVLFEGSGPMGETAAGYNLYFVAERSTSGWSTRSILPRTQGATTVGTIGVQPTYVDPSLDLSHVMFESSQGLFGPPPYPRCGFKEDGAFQLYLGGSDPFLAATWLTRPETPGTVEVCNEEESGVPVGGTPNFSTVYFTYAGTPLLKDAPRARYQTNPEETGIQSIEPWGFYENSNGVVKEAGLLPDGSLDPFGAVPAASGHGRALEGNQIAEEGKRAFFMSPDSASCTENGGQNDCATDPPELYVRENGEKTVLVSRDTLLPSADGLPAGAPNGALAFPGSTDQKNRGVNASFVFASPDGSQAFFESANPLTEEARHMSPGIEPKVYDFNVNTGLLTYLPGVAGQIVATDEHGSSFAFVNSTVSPAELDLWSGSGAVSVRTITQIPGAASVAPTRMSMDGSAVVFQTRAQIPGFNDGGGYQQIYRYDLSSNALSCVSCPPSGVVPGSNAELSPLHAAEELGGGGSLSVIAGLVDGRGISSDGSRVFFDTADPLVPQDSNTGSRNFKSGINGEEVEQVGRDVYEWENGTVYLISSGKSSRNSYFLDNSEDGDDVFFATTEGLAPGDTDGAYDVYDARIPHPGDTQPPEAVPCAGSVCQGPPSVPAPLGMPASSAFSGVGNPLPQAAPPLKTTVTKQTTKCKKGYVKKKNKCVKRPKAKRPPIRKSHDRR